MRIRRGIKKQPRIEMLPLIDIVFLLLVFFIYAMLSMSVHRSQPVQLPSSDSVQIDTNEAITVTLQSEDHGISLFVDTEKIPLNSLTAVLEKKSTLLDKKESKVQVYGDKSVSYQDLFQVLDRIKASGLQHISLAAEKSKAKPVQSESLKEETSNPDLSDTQTGAQ